MALDIFVLLMLRVRRAQLALSALVSIVLKKSSRNESTGLCSDVFMGEVVLLVGACGVGFMRRVRRDGAPLSCEASENSRVYQCMTEKSPEGGGIPSGLAGQPALATPLLSVGPEPWRGGGSLGRER